MRRHLPPRSRLLFGLALVLAVATFALVRGWAARIEAMAPAQPVPVVVAVHDVAAGAVLAGPDVRIEHLPGSLAPPGSMSATAEVVGGTVAAPLLAGEAVTRQRLTEGGPTAALVPDGLRAVLVPTGLPPGAVAAGDRVDVLATYAGARPYTTTVAEGAEIVSVVSADPATETGGPSLFLLVDPPTAERIAGARALAAVDVAIAGAG